MESNPMHCWKRHERPTCLSIARVGAMAVGVFLTAVFISFSLLVFSPGTVHAAVPGAAQTEALGTGDAQAVDASTVDSADTSSMTLKQRMDRMEELLAEIRAVAEQAASKSVRNKELGLELVTLVQIAVLVLIVIAIGFPLSIYLASRKRILGLSGLSSEVSATLVLVEERQAKLANILKDIQSEIDYVHGMSVPDLRKLINQAEKYIEQNEKDLQRTGLRSTGSDSKEQ